MNLTQNAELTGAIPRMFNGKRILVVGDIYLDENVFGAVTSVSLEAPIPVFEVRERRYNPGAAGNAACNMASLGAEVYMSGYVGDDANARIVLAEFAKRGVDTTGVVTAPDRPTNTYGKLRAGGYNIPMQEVLRTDTPHPELVSGPLEDAIIERMRDLAPRMNAIVVTDQAASVASERILREAASLAQKHGLLTVGDSRARAGVFEGFTALAPNDREAGLGVGLDVTDTDALDRAVGILLRRNQMALITRGPLGIRVYDGGAPPVDVAATVPADEVVDVTGAGDTVTAAVTLSLLSGATPLEAAAIGNAAAGVAVKQAGVVTVSQAELLRALMRGDQPAKQRTVEELMILLGQAVAAGQHPTVFRFDGDALTLSAFAGIEELAADSDLVAGFTPDGPGAPERLRLLAGLTVVAYVATGDEPAYMEMRKAVGGVS